MAFFFNLFRRMNGQRATLEALTGLDDHMLNDLGLSRYDLIEARHAHSRACMLLSARRNERATAWLH